MIPGVWHSITYDGEVALTESLIDARGLAFVLDRKDWWTFNGHPVYRGQHVAAASPDRVPGMCDEMRAMADDVNNQPDSRHLKILHDALH